MDYLASLVSAWMSRIREAEAEKERVFGKTARTLWQFLTRSYRDIYLYAEDMPGEIATVTEGEPFYKPRLNKCREFVALYLPFVAARVPVRTVNLRKPPVPDVARLLTPRAQQRWSEMEVAARVMEWWLNYCADETDHEASMRLVVQEALVKGRGVIWAQIYEEAGRLLVGSEADTVDNFLVDPEARTLMDAGYVIRRRVEPKYLAQERYGLTDEEVERLSRAGERARSDELSPPVAKGAVEYYEIYSRQGVGHHLPGMEEWRELGDALKGLGRYVWLVVAEGIDYPLNLRRDSGIQTEEEIAASLRWPLELYGDMVDPWPVTVLDFLPNVDNPWAASPLEPGLPMQVFLDHLYAYIMGRARLATRTVVVASRSLSEDLLLRLTSGKDVEVVPVDPMMVSELRNLYSVMELPDIKLDVWKMIQLVERQFDRAVGLDALLYGAAPSPTPRSATEIDVRRQFLQTRPSEYSDCVEKWSSRVAAKEAIVSRLYVAGETIAGAIGEPPESRAVSPIADLWDRLVQTGDAWEAAAEYAYAVVSGSSRRRNKQVMATNAQTIMQMFGASAMQAAVTTGNVEPYNKVLSMLGQAMDEDLSPFMLQPGQVGAQPGSGPVPAGPAAGKASAAGGK